MAPRLIHNSPRVGCAARMPGTGTLRRSSTAGPEKGDLWVSRELRATRVRGRGIKRAMIAPKERSFWNIHRGATTSAFSPFHVTSPPNPAASWYRIL